MIGWIATIVISSQLVVGAEGSPFLKSFFLRKGEAEASESVHIDRMELELIAEQICYNECRGRIDRLVHWHEREPFPSLGIGHFIWYPEGVTSRYSETFPELLAFFDEQGADIPQWLRDAPFAPWQTRDEFVRDIVRREELLIFLDQTRHLQAEFMAKRLEEALPRMVASLPQHEQLHVLARFHKVKSEPRGTYALLDYLNFKGEGTSERERYNGQGWGLLQVLQRMNPGTGLDEFARCAKEILRRRVANAPAELHEEQWLAGWENRCETYTH